MCRRDIAGVEDHVRRVGTHRGEYEVALLAAAGRSSRAIADSLGITVRTVDNLLGRAYAKLGIAGRAGLVDVLREARTGGASES